MANDLRLKVLLSTIDKATAPLRRINQGSQETASALKAARERLKELNGQQKDVSAWRQQHAQLRETAGALDEARAKVKQLGQAMSAGQAPTKQLTAEFQAAIRATNALKKQHTDEQEALRRLKTQLGAAGVDTRQLQQHTTALRKEMAQANNTIEQQETRLKQLAATQRKVAQAKERLGNAKEMAGTVATAGAAGIAGGVGMGIAGAAMVAPQLDVAQQASMVAAQNGEAGARSGEYAAMIRGMRSDGVATDITEIATAVGAAKSTLAALGPVADKELESAARKALDLSKVMGIDVTEAMQTAGIMMQNGLAKNSTEAFDLLTAGLQKIPQQMRGEIPEILHEYSTHFRSMGYSGSETMSLLVDMAKQGKFALDKTGDAIKEFSIRGSDLSKASREAYASIGLNAEKMSSAIAKGGPAAREAILKTSQALKRIKNPADRANTSIALFGTPIEDLAVDQIPAFLEKLYAGTNSLGDFAGAAEAMGNTVRDNLRGDLDKLTGTWGSLVGSLMDAQNGPLRGLVQQITEVIGAVRTWTAANPELAGNLAKGAAALAVLVAGMGALTVVLASLIGPFAMIRYGMTLFGAKSSGTVSGVGKLASALGGGLLTAIRAVSIALWGLAMNPVAIAIAAVVVALAGAAYLIYQNWDQVKAYFASSWAEIRAGFGAGVGGILTVLANFSPLGLIYQAFAGVLNYLGVEMPTRFTEFGNMIVNGLVNGLLAGMGQIKNAVMSMGDSTIGWFKEKLDIHSPSRVFAALGGFTTQGLALGLDQGAKAPIDAVSKIGLQLTQAGGSVFKDILPQFNGAGASVSAPVSAVTVDNRPPISATPAASYDSHDTYKINIHTTPGMDNQAIARAVRAELARINSEKAARQRSRLADQE